MASENLVNALFEIIQTNNKEKLSYDDFEINLLKGINLPNDEIDRALSLILSQAQVNLNVVGETKGGTFIISPSFSASVISTIKYENQFIEGKQENIDRKNIQANNELVDIILLNGVIMTPQLVNSMIKDYEGLSANEANGLWDNYSNLSREQKDALHDAHKRKVMSLIENEQVPRNIKDQLIKVQNSNEALYKLGKSIEGGYTLEDIIRLKEFIRRALEQEDVIEKFPGYKDVDQMTIQELESVRQYVDARDHKMQNTGMEKVQIELQNARKTSQTLKVDTTQGYFDSTNEKLPNNYATDHTDAKCSKYFDTGTFGLYLGNEITIAATMSTFIKTMRGLGLTKEEYAEAIKFFSEYKVDSVDIDRMKTKVFGLINSNFNGTPLAAKLGEALTKGVFEDVLLAMAENPEVFKERVVQPYIQGLEQELTDEEIMAEEFPEFNNSLEMASETQRISMFVDQEVDENKYRRIRDQEVEASGAIKKETLLVDERFIAGYDKKNFGKGVEEDPLADLFGGEDVYGAFLGGANIDKGVSSNASANSSSSSSVFFNPTNPDQTQEVFSEVRTSDYIGAFNGLKDPLKKQEQKKDDKENEEQGRTDDEEPGQ